MTMLLGRYAEALFWFARYIERSASLARILNVQAAHQQGAVEEENWESLLTLYADEKAFEKAYGEPSAFNIARFYTTELHNPGSILSSLRAARENARLLRPLISVSMWSYVNIFYSELKALEQHELHASRLARTSARLAERCDAIMGVTEGTYYRDAGWRFYQLGLWIERADQTSRLLDVKYAQFATEVRNTEQPPGQDFWPVLLRSFEAYHAFQRVEPGRMDPRLIANFLMFNQSFPRSLTHCIGEIQHMLNDLYLGFHLRQTSSAYEKSELILYELEAASEDPLLHERFHGFNDQIQHRLSDLTDELGTVFFGHDSLREEEPVAELHAQTQSQTQTQTPKQTQTQEQTKPRKKKQKQAKSNQAVRQSTAKT